MGGGQSTGGSSLTGGASAAGTTGSTGGSGGAIASYPDPSATPASSVSHSSVAYNKLGQEGAGMYPQGGGTGGGIDASNVSLIGVLLALNTGGNCTGTSDGGYDLSFPATDTSCPGASNDDPKLAVALGSMAYAVSVDMTSNVPIKVMIPLFAMGLFTACMVCHGELARLKPDPKYLTHFFLMISAGGALGGLLVGFLAPHVRCFRTWRTSGRPRSASAGGASSSRAPGPRSLRWRAIAPMLGCNSNGWQLWAYRRSR